MISFTKKICFLFFPVICNIISIILAEVLHSSAIQSAFAASLSKYSGAIINYIECVAIVFVIIYIEFRVLNLFKMFGFVILYLIGIYSIEFVLQLIIGSSGLPAISYWYTTIFGIIQFYLFACAFSLFHKSILKNMDQNMY